MSGLEVDYGKTNVQLPFCTKQLVSKCFFPPGFFSHFLSLTCHTEETVIQSLFSPIDKSKPKSCSYKFMIEVLCLIRACCFLTIHLFLPCFMMLHNQVTVAQEQEERVQEKKSLYLVNSRLLTHEMEKGDGEKKRRS